jgi:hypothetical protein
MHTSFLLFPYRPKASPATLFLLCLSLGGFGPVQAAGGHHAVDDAALLAPGECQIETWLERRGDGRRLLHGGPACRYGAFEWGLNLDATRQAGAGSAMAAGPQVKWAYPLNDRLAVGLVLSATAQDSAPRLAGGGLVLPLTWQAAPSLQLHLNLGRDFRRSAPDTARSGAALEWAPGASWSFVGEGFREGGATFQRLGARYALGPALQADLSRTWGRKNAADGWTAGVNWIFAR